jgi:hypothetical protein
MSGHTPSQAQQLLARLQAQKEEVESLKDCFLTLFPEDYLPENRQWHIWLNRYDFMTVCESLEATSEWFNKAVQKYEEEGDADVLRGKLDIVKYSSGVMKSKFNKAVAEAK